MGVLERALEHQANGETFVLATVVRTVSVTAAKAGAKALIGPDGSIEEGWIGGGCARAAVVKAARQCMLDGQSRLVSIAPKDALAELGAAAGEERGGVFFAKNSCPSQGTMDVFVEPIMPKPRLLILGASPVAVALARLAPMFGFAVTVAAQPADLDRFGGEPERHEGLAPPPSAGNGAFVVISTQGAGDRAALKAVAAMPARYRAFVGSRRKGETLKRELADEGVAAESLAGVKAPAGLDISAITSEEIALSIIAEMTAVRRGPERPDAPSGSSRGAGP
ncbi:MAG TPA: XdhC family protein [Roseiarcus sp.]|jgi:xanthine dehydrogenase accessory factor